MLGELSAESSTACGTWLILRAAKLSIGAVAVCDHKRHTIQVYTTKTLVIKFTVVANAGSAKAPE